ncbi:hypothetical protein Tco_1383104 [Tanacetum coccineum]
MAMPTSPNHVFNFPANEPHDFDDSGLEFEEDPQEEFEEDPQEELEEDHEKEPKEASELEVDDEADWDEEMNEPELIFPWNSCGEHKVKERVGTTKNGAKRIAKAIAEYKRNQTNPENAGGSGPTNVGGVVAPDMHGCSYKTFRNCQPHSFNRTEGVVGLSRWFKKMEQVFEISKCAEEDKVKFAACTFKGRALTWWIGNMRTLGLANANQIPWTNVKTMMTTDLHDAINMARELIEKAIQAKAMRMGEINKRKWEDYQRNNNNNRKNNTYDQQQNRRQEAAKAYVAAPARGKVYLGNLPLCKDVSYIISTSAQLSAGNAKG